MKTFQEFISEEGEGVSGVSVASQVQSKDILLGKKIAKRKELEKKKKREDEISQFNDLTTMGN